MAYSLINKIAHPIQ